MKRLGLVSVVVVLLLLVNVCCIAQNRSYTPHSKGHAYFQWGWNRGFYSNSNITLKGDDYHLVLKNVKAHDRPTTPVNYHNYLQLDRVTIPQNNWRFGYFIADNWAISLGTDHMKYVMDQNQTVNVIGNIAREGIYKGDYNNQPVVLTEDFLTFEHTDGLNYVNVEVERYNRLGSIKNERFILNAMFGAGSGIMFPKTNAKLLDYERNDRFHVAGFGISAKAAIEFLFLKRVSLKFEAKSGYINMPNIILHSKGINGTGSQNFFFNEFDGVLGWNFLINKPKKVGTTS